MLEDAVHVERPRARLVPVVGHEHHRVLVVGVIDEHAPLAVEHAVDVPHPVCDRRGYGLRVARVAGMDVLEEAVLDPVGRDEDEAGGVPLLGIEQPPHCFGAPPARALDVLDEVERPAAEGRPRAAVDRPSQARPDLGRVAEGRAAGDHAAGDGDAVHRGGGIVERDVRDDDPPARLREPLGPGGREDRPRRHRHSPACARLVLEDVEHAVAGRVPPGEKGRPGRPGVRRGAGPRDAAPPALDAPREVRELAAESSGSRSPSRAVPSHHEYPVGHGR